MRSEEEKEIHIKRRTRNLIAKDLRDNKGPFKQKVVDKRKPQYKRTNINARNYEDFVEKDDE